MAYQYQVSFITAIKRAFAQYCNFYGRASRSEYWWFYLFNLLVGALIFALFGGANYASSMWDMATGDSSIEHLEMSAGTTYSTVMYIWNLIVLLPGLGLFWRRMHDAGHSGWWWLWLLLPLIGWIIVLVALCKASVPTENKYGPVPNLTNAPQYPD